MGITPVKNVRTVQVSEAPSRTSNDSFWKRMAITVIPVLGPVAGYCSQIKIRQKATEVRGYREKLAALKELHQFQAAVTLNLFAYGVMAIAFGCSFERSDLVVVGAVQMVASTEQFQAMNKNAKVIYQLFLSRQDS